MTEVPAVRRLLHYALVVSNFERSQRWYEDMLGAEVPFGEPGFPPRINLAGTVIDMFPAGGTSPAGLPFGSPAPGSIGQHHAFEIMLEDFDNWTSHLARLGQQFRCAAHGTSYMSIYVDDPDGYHIELTVPFEDETKGRIEIEKRGLVPRYVSG